VKIIIKVDYDILIYTKLGIGYTIMYKYTLVIVSNMCIDTGISVHTYTLCITNISYHKMKPLSRSIVILAYNGVKCIGIYELIDALSKVPVWYNVTANVIDVKNIRTHDIDTKYKASYPNWSYKSYLEGEYNLNRGGYKSKIELFNSSNSLGILNETDFKHIYIINTYTNHTDLSSLEIRLYSRKYYSLSGRYMDYRIPHLGRTDEIYTDDLNSGSIVCGKGKPGFNRYIDKIAFKHQFGLHTWDDDINEWIENKKLVQLYLVKYNNGYVPIAGGLIYGVKYKNKAHYNNAIGELSHKAHYLSDITNEVAYKAIIISLYKLRYKKYTNYNKRWLKLKKVDPNNIRKNIIKVDSDAIYYIYSILGVLTTNSKIISKILLTDYKELHNYKDLDKYIDSDSRIDIDKYSTWTYVTDQWLNEYYWLQMQLGSREVYSDIIYLKYANVGESITILGYWYDVVLDDLLYKTSLTRMLAHEYSYYDKLILVDSSTISSVRFGPIYSVNISTAIVPLYDVDHIKTIGDDYMLDSFTHKLNKNQVFLRESEFKWWTTVPHTNSLYASWTKVKADDVNYSIVNSYGANDTNVIVAEYHNYITKIASISIIIENVVYLRKLEITNLVYYLKIGYLFKLKIIRDPHLGMSYTVSLINRAKWRVLVEREYVRGLSNLYDSLNRYYHFKGVLAMNTRIINASIFYSMKSAKILPYNMKYNKDFYWEDHFVYPEGNKAVNIRIKAKIKVLRYNYGWNAAQIVEFFQEEKKWELFLEIIYPTDNTEETYSEDDITWSEIYESVAMGQLNKDVAITEKNAKALDKYRNELHSKYGSVPIEFRKTIHLRQIVKSKLPKLVATSYDLTFSKIVDERIYVYIGNVGTSLDRVIPFKRRGPSEVLKQRKKRVKRIDSEMLVYYKYIMKGERMCIMRIIVYGDHHYDMEHLTEPYGGHMFRMYIDTLHKLHYIDFSYVILDHTMDPARLFPLYEDDVF
jgi:hypothetical protein